MGLFSRKGDDDIDAPVLVWEELKNKGGPRYSYRTKIPGGWLIATCEADSDGIGSGVTFIPDPDHQWNGNSI
ncbi:hypothetical protein [Vibrio nitrifigilis]|uniref:Uncharacterized protein n=1 Tax=Vibrio nitrifigilis TaxID=2789781 RepID=A0ABS0GDR1_9VIBR|nr:hypothetical protein [Vibrio nitrifigilis]MBF9000558.1 hypothetical protein [Vibrio nitrifigilis]